MMKAVEISNIHPLAQFIIFLIERKSKVDICSGYVLFVGIGLSRLREINRRSFVAYTLKIYTSQLIVVLLRVLA